MQLPQYCGEFSFVYVDCWWVPFIAGGTCSYHSALESSVLCMLTAGGFLSGSLERET
jgi:hypothetical protein